MSDLEQNFCLQLCLHCDEDTEHSISNEDGIVVATCSECGNEEVIETEDDE